MLRTAKVRVHGGDYDCSESVRMCYAAAGVLPWGYWDSYMWTGNERDVLTRHGFAEISVSSAAKMRRGDVLLKTGHTEMYLGDNLQAGARGNEWGGISGGKQGDQSGNEIAKSAYRQGQWETAFRYVGSHEVDGIPAAEVAAQVMEHLVDHAAHGYDQPNRGGDGTVEEVTVRWDDGVKEEWEVKPAIYSVKGRNTQFYTDFRSIYDLSSPACRDTFKKLYKQANGEDIKTYECTPDEYALLVQVLSSQEPKHLADLNKKYPSRSPRA